MLTLTIHELPHSLDEFVDNSERMSCSSPDLVLRQSVEPLQHCFNIFLLEKVLYKFDCVMMSKVRRR